MTDDPDTQGSAAGEPDRPSTPAVAPLAFEVPEMPRPLTESRPEILIAAAAAGGFVLAKLVGRLRGR